MFGIGCFEVAENSLVNLRKYAEIGAIILRIYY